VFVQHRSLADLQASDFAYRLELRLVSLVVDSSAQTVTANLLGGYLASQVAMCVTRDLCCCVSVLLTCTRRYRPTAGCTLGALPNTPPPAPFSSAQPPARCAPATNARVQTALENHASRYPNGKTLAVSVAKASTLEVFHSFRF